MKGYLSGRTTSKECEVDKDTSFRSLLSIEKEQLDDTPVNSKIDVIYEDKDCPKVEVLSEDGTPSAIIIHLPDGKLLQINCHYQS
jgi:hypothetical protein